MLKTNAGTEAITGVESAFSARTSTGTGLGPSSDFTVAVPVPLRASDLETSDSEV